MKNEYAKLNCMYKTWQAVYMITFNNLGINMLMGLSAKPGTSKSSSPGTSSQTYAWIY